MTALISTAPDAERFHAMDVLRAGALLLGVAFHAGFAYTQPHFWVVNDSTSDPAIGAIIFVSHIFRMSLFFVIAGFFARLLLERRGVKGFVGNRLKRIALPLATFWLPVFAAIVAFMIMAALKADPSLATKPPPPTPPLTAQNFPLTHLWFLYLLLILYPVALALRGLVALVDGGGALRSMVDKALAATLRLGLVGLALSLPLFVALISRNSWLYWFGIPTPDMSLIPNTAALAGFGMAFGFGWLLHRQQELLEILRRQWPIQLALACALTGYCLWSVGLAPRLDSVPGREKIAYAAAYVLAVWSWIFGLIGLAVRFLNTPSAAWRYLADASYWIYIVHLPLVLALQYAVLDLPAPAAIKFLIVTIGTLLIALATCQLLVRHGFLGAILNGKKTKAPRKALQGQPA
ncbi:acyltransferase family protein [Caulobacter sp. DWR1-3-2b1]|uniref:acyltransferase family protein n=1 Tax=Caulobacter sp. DWR1-3-2b1 TaxID=2804670 RepID=UPI003CF8120F